MISVNDLISLQSENEQLAFIHFLDGRNKRHDTRNIALYRDYLRGKEKQLLNEMNANAYNALKKRLSDQLIDFMASGVLSKELSIENKVIKLIAISRKLLALGHIHTGMTLLKRAENTAIAIEHYSMLNEIYHTMIEYSHKSNKADLASLFKKLEQNNEQFIAQERLSVLYASMQQQFNSSNMNLLPTALHKMYNEGRKSFGINEEKASNFRTLNQLCTLSDIYASQTKNYKDLDLFFEDQIPLIQGGSKDNEQALGYQIELLYGLANIYFRRNDLKKSAFYLEQMNAQMKRYNSKLLERWNARYTSLMALNLNFSSLWKQAYNSIEDCLKNTYLNEAERSLLKLNLCVIHFQQGNLEAVKHQINSLKKTDAWYLKEMGNEWLFNFKAIEVLMHFDLGNDQLAESLILSFKRKYAVHFKNEPDNPIWPFLLLVNSVVYHPEQMLSPKFQQKVESSIPWKEENEDFFNLCFYAWLKAKMNNTPIYETTLELLKPA